MSKTYALKASKGVYFLLPLRIFLFALMSDVLIKRMLNESSFYMKFMKRA